MRAVRRLSMSIKLNNKSIPILLISDSGMIGMRLKSLNEAGFDNVKTCHSCSEGLNLMQSTFFGWVITEFAAEEKINGFDILKVCNDTDILRSVCVSLIIEKKESYCLAKAFELGLFSWFYATSEDKFDAQLNQLVSRLEQNDYDANKTAFDYLRAFLKKKKLYKNLIEFETGVLKLDENSAEQNINLAIANFVQGNIEEGQNLLSKAKGLIVEIDNQPGEDAVKQSVKLKKRMEAICQKYLGKSADHIGFTYKLKSCVVVDPDDAIHPQIAKALKNFGNFQIQYFSEAKEACRWLEKNGEPGLIIQEWKLQGVSGNAFVQQVRQFGFFKVPIVVFSAHLTESDKTLLHEMTVAGLIIKPVNDKVLFNNLVSILNEQIDPTQSRFLKQDILNNLKLGKLKRALALRKKYFSLDKIPAFEKYHVNAEIAFHQGDYNRAKENAEKSLRKNPQNLNVINLMGKILLKLDDYEEALTFLEKAKKFSPQDIERLCEASDAGTENGQLEEAEAAIALGRKFSADGEQKLDENAFKEESSSVTNVVSFLNNRAVLLSKCNKLEESVELYKKSLKSIPLSFVDTRAMIAYNLALSYSKQDRLSEALSLLQEIVSNKQVKIYSKAHSLLKKVENTLKTGEVLQLNVASNDIKKSHNTTIDVDLLSSISGENLPEQDRQANLSLEEISFCRNLFSLPEREQSKKIQQYLHEAPDDFTCKVEETTAENFENESYIELSTEIEGLSIGQLDLEPLKTEFDEIVLLQKELPVPRKLKEDKLIDSLKKSWQRYHKRLEVASKAENIMYADPVLLLHYDYSGGKSISTEMEKLGMPLVECINEPHDALDEILARRIKILVIWYDPYSSNFEPIYHLLSSLIEIRSSARVIVLILTTGDRGLKEFSERGKDLFYDHIAVFDRNRSKFRKILEGTFIKGSDQKSISNVLYRLRGNHVGLSPEDFLSHLSKLKSNVKRYWIFSEYIRFLLESNQRDEAKKTLEKFKPLYANIFDFILLQAKVTDAFDGWEEAANELIENCLAYDDLNVHRIGMVVEELIKTGSVDLVNELLVEWSSRSDLACNYYFNYLCSLYFKMTKNMEKEQIYLFSCVSECPYKQEFIAALCRFFEENGKAGLAQTVRSFTEIKSKAA